MVFKIMHRLVFTYDDQVALDPFIIRMRPRTDASQTLLTFHLESTPVPIRNDSISTLDGNTETRFWFDGFHPRLSIQAVSQVRTLLSNPFDFLFSDLRAQSLPLSYPPELSSCLVPYLPQIRRPAKGSLFREFVDHLQKQSHMETIPFLTLLARTIADNLRACTREKGPPLSPEETLNRGSGSCRDFAVLAMETCRYFRIASRFTSGYHLPVSHERPALHGWVEVYLPEIGWRGLDPSEGLLTADHHVALVSSPDPARTLPTEGSFRGGGHSSLHSTITLDLLPDHSKEG